jgi:5,10-methylenetetrahydromethanopterin reductase
MRLSCGFAPRPDAPDRAREAENLGYHRAYFADSPAFYGDVWITLSRVLDATERIGVGTAVLVPSLRHVVATAAAIATLEAQAPGRLRVAIGTGFTGRALFGKPPMKLADVGDYVRALQALLRGEEALVEGKVCKLMSPEGVIAKRPIEVPILLAAGGPRALALARELSDDGVMCAGVVLEGAQNVSYLSPGTVLAPDETFESPRVVEAIGPALAVVYHGAYQAGGAAVDALPGGADWREEVEAFPEEVRHLYAHEGHYYEQNERDRRHVSPALGPTTFSGTPEALRERRDALATAGVTELVYWPMGPDLGRELRAMRDALEI